MFKFLRDRRRKKLARQPFPESWEPIVEKRLGWIATLGEEERERARTHLKVFLWEKHWIGAREFDITEEMKITISGQAARLSRNIGLDAYDRLTEIIVYPSHYVHPERDAIIYGEAHTWGTVVLSWDAVRNGLTNPTDGRDTSLHEFAHVLDIADGWFDGTPVLHRTRDYTKWGKVLGHYYSELREDPDRGVVREYGAINEAEFFAVSTEAFFERPKTLRRKAPDLYKALARFYKTDEAAR
jgi:Mlc titration factor MtfA (ptsG expression regulator)